MLDELLSSGLIWFPEKGIGYLKPTKGFVYGPEYEEDFRQKGLTELGKKINEARVEFVEKFVTGELLDFGCGAGTFIRTRGKDRTLGFDIMKGPVKWLKKERIYKDPLTYTGSLCFWDSLEHLNRPDLAVLQSREWVFISMPVYEDPTQLLKSKHFKPNEHIWYWTRSGLTMWMHFLGFDRLSTSWVESELGREGVSSFAFKRR